ncbi:MAG: hypothetical protein HFI32_15515 [Lachnospiraceae bacterium]|nr:hypothetical protein [Lachnospiraceae bacterium]
MHITQDTFINQLANREGLSAGMVRQTLKAAERLLFDYVSSIAPAEELTIKLFSGFTVQRKYVPGKTYSRGMFQNIQSPEHVTAKVSLSKYYMDQVNQKLFDQ